MTIGLIWAQSDGGVIGKDGVLPWHVPEDMARFKALTGDSAVIMGRRTWDSIPQRFRPLAGRTNIVVTRQLDWFDDGAVPVHSVSAALDRAGGTAWVIGGAELYSATIHVADLLEVTEIDEQIDGDTLAPRLGSTWQQLAADPVDGWHTSIAGHRYRFVSYRRRPQQA
jgi:dihydrofolate reductase